MTYLDPYEQSKKVAQSKGFRRDLRTKNRRFSTKYGPSVGKLAFGGSLGVSFDGGWVVKLMQDGVNSLRRHKFDFREKKVYFSSG